MAPPRILVFDDDLVSRPEFLGHLPAEFIYRGHADQALADVEQVMPDMVFMDFAMGTAVDGVTATQTLRRFYALEVLPIVAISSDARMNRLMLMAGATEGVPKMALPERFREIVHLLPVRRDP
ncbi:MAG: response regulator [Myxococcota bacterium]